jgi:hypothetical protein
LRAIRRSQAPIQAAKLADVCPSHEERVLGDVFGGLPVPNGTERQPADGPIVLLRQFGEGLRGAVSGAAYRRLIALLI